MATILGLHYGHNGTACILKDGRLVVALSSERLTRHKFSHGIADDLLDYVFADAGMTIADIDCIALSDWNPQFAYHDIQVNLGGKPAICLWNTIFDNEVYALDVTLRGKRLRAYHIGHHMGHAAAAYYTSSFDESFAFTMDASGGKHKSNCLVAYGNGDQFYSLYCPNLMIGVAYGFFTEYLGIGPQVVKAGATMALAGYGEPLQRVKDNLGYYVEGCFFPNEREYRQWYPDLWKLFSGSEHYTHEQSDSKMAQDIAASMQLLFETSVLKCVNQIEARGCKNICLGGGSMLNCVTNSKILRESQFDNVHLFPGCGDDGCCVGTAFYVAHHLLKEPRVKHAPQEVCFLGPDRPAIEPDYAYLAEEIANGKIIAWCNSRGEFGPRALGNRSLLADPRNPASRERINFQIKNREWYRPLAPVVMEEYTRGWFDFPINESPFMLFTAPIKNPDLIPSVNHIDNSARIQTVNETENPMYYRLIKAFYEITGVPILVNTSFNTNGEPLVETDEQALATFNRSPIDILVLNGKIHRKDAL